MDFIVLHCSTRDQEPAAPPELARRAVGRDGTMAMAAARANGGQGRVATGREPDRQGSRDRHVRRTARHRDEGVRSHPRRAPAGGAVVRPRGQPLRDRHPERPRVPGGSRGAIEKVAEYDGEPNGLKIHRDGRIFVADHKQGLLELDPATGRVAVILDRPYHERFKGLNDLMFARNGDLYLTDQGEADLRDPTGRLFCLRADGRLDCLLDCVPSPNGLVLTPTRASCTWR